MRIRSLSFLTVIVLYTFMSVAPVARSEETPVFYKGLRPLGMGGAFTAVADDENAIFYNPAGLNKIEGFGGLDLVNPYVELSKYTAEFLIDLRDVEDAETDSEQAALVSDLMERWMGRHFHLRTGAFPNLTVHNFGIGVLGQGYFDGEVHNFLGSDAVSIRAGYDIAGVMSLAYGLFDQTIQIGVTGKAIRRKIIDRDYTGADLVNMDGISIEDARAGTGIGADAGVIINLPLPLKPSIGATIQNIGDIDLKEAGMIERQVNVGVALQPDLGIGTLTLAVDMMDAGKNLGSDKDTAKRLHAGAELKLRILSVRAGISQGYPTAGLTLDLWIVKFGYAYYVEEIGAYAGQRPDYRHLAQLSIGF